MPSNTRALLPDERQYEAHEQAMTFYEQDGRDGKAGGVAPESTKVGFTLRDKTSKAVARDESGNAHAFAFLINPQGLGRSHGTRSTLHATQARVYVNDFGWAPYTITLRQLVASGKVIQGGFYTEREDVQRFLERIYLPAIANRSRWEVMFHDHHYERGSDETVMFPPNSLDIQRDVSLHGVWLVQLQMIGLEKLPYKDVDVEPSAPRSTTARKRRYTVRSGDTLHKLIVRWAGKGASAAKRKRLLEAVLKANPKITKRRQLKVKTGSGTQTIEGKPNHVYPGEVLIRPS